MAHINFNKLVVGPAMRLYADAVIYTDALGLTFDTEGIFDADHAVGEMEGDIPVSGVAPVLKVSLADWPGAAPRQGDALVIAGTAYIVNDPQPKSDGTVTLILRRA